MSEYGTFDGDELDFTLDDEAPDDGPLPPGPTFPLPSALASVLMAWAIGHPADPDPGGEEIGRAIRKVLLVEDDRGSRLALGRLLVARGWVVAEAGTLAEGLASLDPPPSCVVLDLMLPDGDGADLLRRIRSAGLPTRVVVATGVDDEARLEAVAGLRPDSFHRKPVDIETICRDCDHGRA